MYVTTVHSVSHFPLSVFRVRMAHKDYRVSQAATEQRQTLQFCLFVTMKGEHVVLIQNILVNLCILLFQI